MATSDWVAVITDLIFERVLSMEVRIRSVCERPIFFENYCSVCSIDCFSLRVNCIAVRVVIICEHIAVQLSVFVNCKDIGGRNGDIIWWQCFCGPQRLYAKWVNESRAKCDQS